MGNQKDNEAWRDLYDAIDETLCTDMPLYYADFDEDTIKAMTDDLYPTVTPNTLHTHDVVGDYLDREPRKSPTVYELAYATHVTEDRYGWVTAAHAAWRNALYDKVFDIISNGLPQDEELFFETVHETCRELADSTHVDEDPRDVSDEEILDIYHACLA